MPSQSIIKQTTSKNSGERMFTIIYTEFCRMVFTSSRMSLKYLFFTSVPNWERILLLSTLMQVLYILVSKWKQTKWCYATKAKALGRCGRIILYVVGAQIYEVFCGHRIEALLKTFLKLLPLRIMKQLLVPLMFDLTNK